MISPAKSKGKAHRQSNSNHDTNFSYFKNLSIDLQLIKRNEKRENQDCPLGNHREKIRRVESGNFHRASHCVLGKSSNQDTNDQNNSSNEYIGNVFNYLTQEFGNSR